MENQNQNQNVTLSGDSGKSPVSSGFGTSPLVDYTEDSLSLVNPVSERLSSDQSVGQPVKRVNFLVKAAKRADVVLVILLVISVAAVLIVTSSRRSPVENRVARNDVGAKYDTQTIPLSGFVSTEDGLTFEPRRVAVNGVLKVNGGVVITPSLQPGSPQIGQLYFDEDANQLGYYNGSGFILLPPQEGAVVESLGGVSGQVGLAGGLSIVGNQLVNAGLLSIGGANGAIVLGNGLNMNNNVLQNTGVLNLTAGTPNVTVTNNGGGSFSVGVTGSGTGTVGSGGGTIGAIPVFTASQNIEDSLLSQSGALVTVGGNLSVTGSVSLTSALSVANGGTGATSLSPNGVIVGNGTGALTSVTSAGSGLCLLSTAGAPAFAACPSGGAPNNAAYLLTTLDGTLTNDRALAAGSNISLTDGGAGSNFTVATTQNPTFTTSVTTPILQSSSALAISSAAGQMVAINAGTTIELQDDTNITGALDISGALNAGNTNAFQINSSGAIVAATGITSSGTIIFSALNCTGNANGGALTANGSGQLVCTDDDGAGASTITGSGTNGTIPLFNGAQTITNSIITQAGTTITIAGDLSLNTDLTVANGGTGVSSFTSNGVLYGNNAGSLQVTAAGTGGQVLVANGSGVPTFMTITGDIAVSNTGVTTVQSNSIDLGTDTTGNYVATLGALTGLNTSGNTGEGSTPTLSVIYGSGANTAVQGNVTVTCPSGTGNLTGGGTSITLGSGGTCANLSTINNPTFSTSVTTPTLIFTGAGSNGSIQIANLGQAVTYTLPDPGQATATICLTTGNCAGSGGGVTGSGTNDRLAKFTSTGSTIGDSTITDNGTTVTTTADLVIQGGDLTVGTAGGQLGSLVLYDGDGETTTLQAGDSAGGLTFVLPITAGSANQCLKKSSGNQLVWDDCDGGAGGTSGTLQDAYDNSTSPEIVVDTTRGALTVRDNATPLAANLLEVQNNAGGTTYLAVSASGTTITSGLTVTGGTSINTTGSAATSIGNSSGTLTVTGSNSSTFVLNGVSVDATEFNRLDGKDAALIDTNDAVATAITGTGALNSGSITSGFGAIDTGADNITTTGTIQGTASVLTSVLDRVSSGTLIIGNGTATQIDLGTNVSITSTNTFTSGTGLVLLQGNTDVAASASLATRRGATYTTAGSANDVALNVASLYILDTSGAAQTITGIAAGRDGQYLTLVNGDAAQPVTLSNLSGSSAAANQISTGTGANVSVAAGGSITLVYDTASSLWRVIGGVAGGNGTCSGCANTALSNLAGVNINTALNATSANLNLTTTTSGNIVLTSAGTIELQDNTNVTGTLGVSSTLTVTAGGASIAGNTTIATTAGNTLGLGNSTGALTVTGSSGSTFVINGVTVDATEFNRLDGKDAALVDTNDAVTTAITGTGTLTSGALGAGFTTVAVGQGGTGATTFASNGVLYGNSTGAIQATAAGTNGQCLVGNTGSAPTWTSCTGLVTLQNAYANGSTISTTSNDIGFTINGGQDFTVTSTNSASGTIFSSTATSGTILSLTNSTAGQTTARLLDISSSGYTTGYTGNVVNVSGTSTTGSGNLVNLVNNGLNGSGTVLNVNSSSTGAFTNGLAMFNGSAAHTGSVVNIQSASTTGVALNVAATSLSSGSAINVTAGTGTAINVTSGLTVLSAPASGSGDTLSVSNATSTGNIAIFKDDSTAVFTLADGGSAVFRNQTNSATAFRIQNASPGTETLFTADTTTRQLGVNGNRIKIGNSVGSDTDVTILQLDAVATAGVPATELNSLNGGLFYDSSASKVSIIENGQVKQLCNLVDLGCGAGATTPLQTSYNDDVDGGNATISLTTADDSLVFTNPTSNGTDSAFLLQLNQQHTTAGVVVADIIQSSNNANAVNLTANSIDTETALAVSATSLTTGIGLSVAAGNNVTSGSAIRVTAAGTSAIATNGLVSIQHTGAYTGSGGLLSIQGNSTTAGTVASISGSSLTTGIGLDIAPGNGITSGAALRVSAAGTSAIANGLVQVTHTGAYTSTGGLLNVTGNSTTSGNLVSLSSTAITTGIALNIAAGNNVTSGSAIRVSAAGTSAIATNGLVSVQHTGAFTSTGGLLNVQGNSTTSGTIASISGTSLTSGIALNIAANTGTAINVTSGLTTLDGNLQLGQSADRTITVLARSSNAAGRALTIQAGAAGSGGSPFAGGGLNLLGGNAAGTGDQDGGSVTIQGGAPTGGGESGQVIVQANTTNRWDLFQVRNKDGNRVLNVDTFSSNLTLGTGSGLPTQDFDITFDDGSADSLRSIGVDDSTTTDGKHLLLQAGTSTAAGGNGGSIILAGGDKNGAGTGGGVIVRNVADYTGADSFKVQTAASADIFTVNASSNTIKMSVSGGILDLASATNGNTAILKVPQKATTGVCTSAASEGLRIQNTGGTQVGHICIDGPTSGTANKLRFYAEQFSATSTDVAENYSDTANNLEPGDLVALDMDSLAPKAIKRATSTTVNQLLGVISTSSGILLSGISESDGSTDLVNPKPVALVGRIPTKVSTQNGVIAIGDYLTISSIPGVAMKATSAGTVIGRALESYAGGGVGKIEVFSQLGYYPGPDSADSIQNGHFADLLADGTIQTANLTVAGAATIANLTVTGSASVQTLAVAGSASVGSLTVQNGITTTTLTVSGAANVQSLHVADRIVLGANSEDPETETAHPITKRFKASKAIAAGSVVIADATPGWATTTTTTGDTRVVGVAVTAAANPGEIIEVAIGGTAKVMVAGSTSIGQMLHSDAIEGRASAIATPTPGEVIGKVLGTPDVNGQVLLLIALQ